MQLKSAFFCNYSNISTDNKLNVLGILSNALVNNFPITLAPLAFVACLEGKSIEHGKRGMKLEFRDPDGFDIIQPIEFEANVTPFANKNRKDLFFNLSVALPPITFFKAGNYAMNVFMDNRLIDVVTLPVYTD